MYEFDFVSMMFGICFGVVPAVIGMTIAGFADDRREKEK